MGNRSVGRLDIGFSICSHDVKIQIMETIRLLSTRDVYLWIYATYLELGADLWWFRASLALGRNNACQHRVWRQNQIHLNVPFKGYWLQNTVPSLSISIGGPLVSGRFCFAISRPPFHVALSSTCARVRLGPFRCFRKAAAIRSL